VWSADLGEWIECVRAAPREPQAQLRAGKVQAVVATP
jgi:hypothetical protein